MCVCVRAFVRVCVRVMPEKVEHRHNIASLHPHLIYIDNSVGWFRRSPVNSIRRRLGKHGKPFF